MSKEWETRETRENVDTAKTLFSHVFYGLSSFIGHVIGEPKESHEEELGWQESGDEMKDVAMGNESVSLNQSIQDDKSVTRPRTNIVTPAVANHTVPKLFHQSFSAHVTEPMKTSQSPLKTFMAPNPTQSPFRQSIRPQSRASNAFSILDFDLPPQTPGKRQAEVIETARKRPRLTYDATTQSFMTQEQYDLAHPPQLAPRDEAGRILSLLEGMRTPLKDSRWRIEREIKVPVPSVQETLPEIYIAQERENRPDPREKQRRKDKEERRRLKKIAKQKAREREKIQQSHAQEPKPSPSQVSDTAEKSPPTPPIRSLRTEEDQDRFQPGTRESKQERARANLLRAPNSNDRRHIARAKSRYSAKLLDIEAEEESQTTSVSTKPIVFPTGFTVPLESKPTQAPNPFNFSSTKPVPEPAQVLPKLIPVPVAQHAQAPLAVDQSLKITQPAFTFTPPVQDKQPAASVIAPPSIPTTTPTPQIFIQPETAYNPFAPKTSISSPAAGVTSSVPPVAPAPAFNFTFKPSTSVAPTDIKTHVEGPSVAKPPTFTFGVAPAATPTESKPQDFTASKPFTFAPQIALTPANLPALSATTSSKPAVASSTATPAFTFNFGQANSVTAQETAEPKVVDLTSMAAANSAKSHFKFTSMTPSAVETRSTEGGDAAKGNLPAFPSLPASTTPATSLPNTASFTANKPLDAPAASKPSTFGFTFGSNLVSSQPSTTNTPNMQPFQFGANSQASTFGSGTNGATNPFASSAMGTQSQPTFGVSTATPGTSINQPIFGGSVSTLPNFPTSSTIAQPVQRSQTPLATNSLFNFGSTPPAFGNATPTFAIGAATPTSGSPVTAGSGFHIGISDSESTSASPGGRKIRQIRRGGARR